MELAQIEKIIRDRIDELKAVEKTEHSGRLRISLQDKRDELESLLLRLHGMETVSRLDPVGRCPTQPTNVTRRTFDQAWALKEAEGYQYGPDALEQVRFGWEIALAESADKEGPASGVR